MAQLKALLIGVTEYVRRSYEAVGSNGACRLVTKDMPSAERDVDNMLRVLCRQDFKSKYSSIAYKCLTGRLPVPDETHLDARVTTRESILDGIKWLFEGATAQHQLLFYFSGHSIRFESTIAASEVSTASATSATNATSGINVSVTATANSGGSVKVIKECLCPSDTDWNSPLTCIGEEDVFCASAYAAMTLGARLEVVLETCSAGGFANPAGLPLRPFGSFVSTQGMTKNAAVWSACLDGQHSHSAPFPACSAEPVRGLFTQFFRDELATKTRDQLLGAIRPQLDAYRVAFNSCCQGRASMDQQTPELYAQDRGARPLWR